LPSKRLFFELAGQTNDDDDEEEVSSGNQFEYIINTINNNDRRATTAFTSANIDITDLFLHFSLLIGSFSLLFLRTTQVM
jgi:hypothetical protein